MKLLNGHYGIWIRADEAMTARSIEIDFLRECLRRSLLNPGTPARNLPDPSLSLPRNVDWSALLALAEENRVTALVYPTLASIAPEPFADAWRTGWLNAELLAAELESLLDVFADRGIEVMPLKGPVLAEALYGDRTARQSGDLDLLVESLQFPAAKALLLELGYIAEPPRRIDFHQAFHKPNAMVELHWSLGTPDRCPLDTEEVWSRSTPGTFGVRAVRMMAEEDLVLYLGYHMLKHHCRTLLWTADLSLALERVERNGGWQTLLRAAQNQGLFRLLLCTCLVVEEVLGRPLPAELTTADPERTEMQRQVHAFFEIQLAGQAEPMRFPEIWQPAGKIESGAGIRWRGFMRLLPTWRDRLWAESHGIPRPLLVLLLPGVRLIRILRKYGPVRAWKAFFHSLRG
jgi:hypothetical protein